MFRLYRDRVEDPAGRSRSGSATATAVASKLDVNLRVDDGLVEGANNYRSGQSADVDRARDGVIGCHDLREIGFCCAEVEG